MTPGPPVRFDAPLELLPWGRNTYTVVKLPEELVVQARRESTWRVAGDIDGLAVNLGLNRADVIPDTFVYVGVGLQRRLGVRAGDVVRCVFAPVDPDLVPMPEDVRGALDESGRRDAFERQPASERRRLLSQVEGAARPSTRARRIAALVASLPVD